MQNNIIGKHWKHIVVVVVLFSIAFYAAYLRLPNAIEGILYNGDDEITPTVYTSETVSLVIPQEVDVNFGVYDFSGGFEQSQTMAIQHEYFSWLDFDRDQYMSYIVQAELANRWPLLTIEPFNIDGDEALLESIIAGRYDEEIKTVCTAINDSGSSHFIRWGHEMENVTGRYPWAQSNGSLYTEAYQYFVDSCREFVDAVEVFFVWSPVGNKELDDYWPGREYADYVGVSVYAFNEWEYDYYGEVRSFEEIFDEKYNRVKRYDRPVMIAEIGVTGSEAFQQLWISGMYGVLPNYPLLKTVVLFNAPDSPGAWDEMHSVPDWTVSSDLFQ